MMLGGMYESGSVQLQEIGMCLEGEAKLTSQTRKLSRFLSNMKLPVRKSYAQVILPVLKKLAKKGRLELVIDGTKVGFGHQLLLVGVAYQSRVIPVAWTWVRHGKGHSKTRLQLALLGYVHQLLSSIASQKLAIRLVGDSEFGHTALYKQLDLWGWQYAIRQKQHVLIRDDDDKEEFRKLSGLVKSGTTQWLQRVFLTRSHPYPVNIVLHWDADENKSWVIVTNCNHAHTALAWYRRRMWIENLFGDLKSKGFDLQATHLRSSLKLDRLVFFVCLIFLWLLSFGSHAIQRGHRALVDRNDRRDLSLFQIGLRLVKRFLLNHTPFSLRLVPL